LREAQAVFAAVMLYEKLAALAEQLGARHPESLSTGPACPNGLPGRNSLHALLRAHI